MGRIMTIAAMVALTVSFANINTASAQQCLALHGAGGYNHFPGYKVNGKKVMFLHDTQARTLFITGAGRTRATKCKPVVSYDTSSLVCSEPKFEKFSVKNLDAASGWRVVCRAKPGFNDSRSKVEITAGSNSIEVDTFVFRKLELLLAQIRKVRSAGISPATLRQIEANMKLSRANEERLNNQHQRITDNSKLAKSAYENAEEAKARTSANMDFGMGLFYTFAHQGVDLLDGRSEKDRRYPSWGIELSYTWWAKSWNFGIHKISVGPSSRLRWHTFVLTILGTPPDDDLLARQYEAVADFSFRWKVGKWFSLEACGGMGLGLLHHSDQTSDPGTMDGVRQNMSAQFLLHGGASVNLHLWSFVLSANVSGTWTPSGLYHPNHLNPEGYWDKINQGFLGLMLKYTH